MFAGKQDFSDDSFVTRRCGKISPRSCLSKTRSFGIGRPLQLKLLRFLLYVLSHLPFFLRILTPIASMNYEVEPNHQIDVVWLY
jgi:hypothetical protein